MFIFLELIESFVVDDKEFESLMKYVFPGLTFSPNPDQLHLIELDPSTPARPEDPLEPLEPLEPGDPLDPEVPLVPDVPDVPDPVPPPPVDVVPLIKPELST
jgi:hypothetical protein